MERFTVVSGIAAPMPDANIDTDLIMPKRYLKGVDRAGLQEGVFHDLRFNGQGELDPEFILNRMPWHQATFLVVGHNFGCGSSREHAVWGLRQCGVRALIGTSFAGIFFDNCARNGLLALTLAEGAFNDLLTVVSDPASARLTIDLAQQTLTTVRGKLTFDVDPLLKAMLLEGVDSVGATLKHRSAIEAFEEDYLSGRPWLREDAQRFAHGV